MALVGLRASYRRLLDKIELLLPAKLRPLYNHPAGNVRGVRVHGFLVAFVCLLTSLTAWCNC